MTKIPYGRQFIDHEDIKSVTNSLKKKLITTGLEVTRFESKISQFLKCKYTTVCNSGTSALLLALLSIGTQKDDIIIMPSVTFVASFNVSSLLGAKIFLADINQITGQMSPTDVLDCCKKFNLKKIKAVINMYNGGYPENASNFIALKKKLKCYLIEDACHAFGAEYNYKGKYFKIGSCRHADISTFSLHPLKTITTGEGGVVTTNSKKLDDKIKFLRSHGIIRNKKKHWKLNVIANGLNLRLNNFQCALGISQLKKINLFLKFRKQIANRYLEELKKINKIIIPNYTKKNKSSYHLFLIIIKNGTQKIKNKFMSFMKKKGVIVQFHYIPIYKFAIFKGKYIGKKSEIYYNSAVSIPIYYGLNKKDQNHIINLIKNFFNNS
jgi:dTDP-4-amino-4,6-dideoxygalactose transaminase